MAGPTTGYQAGTESNQVEVSYAAESAWGVVPAVAFQKVRLTSETLAGTKTRTRPTEINTSGEVSAAITTQESAGGGLNFALSYGTFDDLLAGALNNDWGNALTLNGSSGNISVTAGAAGTSRNYAGPASTFTALTVGQWIKVRGFTQTAANGLFRVTAVAGDGTTVTVLNAALTTAETPAGSAVQIRASRLANSTVFKSFSVQKKFNSALFLRYVGSFVSGSTLSGGAGQFLNGSFTFLSQSESSFTVDASTGAALAAPLGRVHDPVGGFNGVYVDGQPIAAIVDSFQITTQDTGAVQEFGMGFSAAQGIIMGLLEAKGSLKVYFKDFTLYTRFKSETAGAFSFATSDASGNTYVITLNTANLINPKINAGGQNQPVYAMFDLEGNPSQIGLPTVQIDRLSAT